MYPQRSNFERTETLFTVDLSGAPRDAETASPPQSNSVIRLMAMSATVLNLNKRLYSSFQIIAQTSAALC